MPGIDRCLRKEFPDIFLLGFCLFGRSKADPAQKVYERKFVAPAQPTDNERKEILSGIADLMGGSAMSTDKKFSVRIFRVDEPCDEADGQPSFEDAILNADSLSLDEREMFIDPKERRLDRVKKVNDTFLLNFTTFSYPGPGRVKSGQRPKSFTLAGDEFFAIQTAMLYDTETSLAFVEATQGGMGAGTVAKYFEGLDGQDAVYDMIPLLDEEASARARRCKQFRKVVMRVAISQVNSLDRELGLGPIEALGESFNAKTMDIGFNVDRVRSDSLLPESVRKLVNFVTNGDDAAVQKLIVHGRRNDDDQMEIIDLLKHQEKRERMLPVDPNSRKILRKDKWKALVSIHKNFDVNVP